MDFQLRSIFGAVGQPVQYNRMNLGARGGRLKARRLLENILGLARLGTETAVAFDGEMERVGWRGCWVEGVGLAESLLCLPTLEASTGH